LQNLAPESFLVPQFEQINPGLAVRRV